MTLSPPPLLGYKESRHALGVNDRLFAELVRTGVLAPVSAPDGGPRLYLRATIEALAVRVRGVRYGRRRILLGCGRKSRGECLLSAPFIPPPLRANAFQMRGLSSHD